MLLPNVPAQVVLLPFAGERGFTVRTVRIGTYRRTRS